MEKKKDYLLVYVTIIFVVAAFGWMLLKPAPTIYYGAISQLEEVGDEYHFTFEPAQSPYPDSDLPLTGTKTGIVGANGVELQIRSAPDGTKQQHVNLTAMFEALQVGDEVAFIYDDKAETILKTIIFTDGNQ